LILVSIIKCGRKDGDLRGSVVILFNFDGKIIPFDLVGAVIFSPFCFGSEVLVIGPNSVLVKISKARVLALGSFSDLLRDFLPLVRRFAFAPLGLCLTRSLFAPLGAPSRRAFPLKAAPSPPGIFNSRWEPTYIFWSFLPPVVRSGLSSFATAGQKFMFFLTFFALLVLARCL
jgi:hypothetical protein